MISSQHTYTPYSSKCLLRTWVIEFQGWTLISREMRTKKSSIPQCYDTTLMSLNFFLMAVKSHWIVWRRGTSWSDLHFRKTVLEAEWRTDWEVVRLSQGGYSRGRCSQRDRETGVASCKGGNYIAGREGDGMEEGLAGVRRWLQIRDQEEKETKTHS